MLKLLLVAFFLFSPSLWADGEKDKKPSRAEIAYKEVRNRLRPERPQTVTTTNENIVAIGDIHGDFEVLKKVLRMSKLIDDQDNWIGGRTVMVQVGDLLGRGPGEREAIDFLEELKEKAEQVGGKVHVLNGNHEVMNVNGNFNYVSLGGFAAFQDFTRNKVFHDHKGTCNGNHAHDEILKIEPFHTLLEAQRGREIAMMPQDYECYKDNKRCGEYADIFSSHNTVMIINDTLFVHGGVEEDHIHNGVQDLETVNTEISDWMYGAQLKRPKVAIEDSGPLWSRKFGKDERLSRDNCRELGRVLDKLNVKRMVVAHTRQDKINSQCSDRVWRIDTGMSAYYGARPKIQSLKIIPGQPGREAKVEILD